MKHLTRRSFLQHGTLAASGSLLSTSLLSTPLPASRRALAVKMRLGLVTYLWGQDWDLPTLIANCEKSGLLGVELRTQHKHGVEPHLNPAQRAEVRKRFADSRVNVLGPGTNWAFHSPDPSEVKKNLDGARRYVVLSHDIGGTGLKVKPNALPKNVPVQKTIEQIGKSLNTLGKFADGYGQQIRVEVHGRDTQELPIMKRIMDVATHKRVSVCWNSNDADLNGKGLKFNFNSVQSRFGDTCHVRELNVGSYPYGQLMDLLVGIDYAGWVLLECRTKPKDRVAAMIEQRQVFEKMTADSLTRQHG